MTERAVTATVAGDASEDVYGLLTVAGVEVALALSSLREVVPCPDGFTLLPTRAVGLLGTMEVRELVVPVVDLAPRMGWETERGTSHVVVVLSDGVRLLGVLADRLRHVQQVPAAQLLKVHQEGDDVLVTHTFRDTANGGIISVLDVPAILGMRDVPTIDVPAGSPASARTGGPTGTSVSPAATPFSTSDGGSDGRSDVASGRRGLTLVQCGPYVLAFDVHQVHTTLPSCDASPSVLDSALCLGTMAYTGREVAVVDPLVLLGLGQLPADATNGPGLVLELAEGYVVLALTALLDIVDVGDTDIMPLPPFTVRRPTLFDGIAATRGGRSSMVLHGQSLLADTDLQALAHMNVERDDATSAVTAGAAAVIAGSSAGPVQLPGVGEPHLRYFVGVDVVTPLQQICEILPFPQTLTQTHVEPFVLGIISHRGAVVPVLCLRTLLDMPTADDLETGCLLLVEINGQRVAYVVDALQGMEPLTWQDDEDPGAAAGAYATPSLRTSPLVQVRGDTRLLPQLDLLAVTRTVQRSDAYDASAPAMEDSALEYLDELSHLDDASV